MGELFGKTPIATIRELGSQSREDSTDNDWTGATEEE